MLWFNLEQKSNLLEKSDFNTSYVMVQHYASESLVSTS